MPQPARAVPTATKKNGKKHVTQQSVDAAIWSICDIMRRGNVASALQYVPEQQFDVILTNPPFGGKESAAAQTNFDYRTSATQVLFLQHVMRALRTDGGRCGMVIDEGVLFRTNEDAFVKTKRKLTDECDLWCILSLPGGVFSTAGACVKTNLLFFTKGRPTEKIWYYDLSDVKVGKKTPLTLKHFEDFAAKLATREDSERSWTVDLSARRAKGAADAQPFKDTARGKSQEADRIKD